MYISIHLPKTAGTTFKLHLEEIFGDKICYDYQSGNSVIDIYPATFQQGIYRILRDLKVQRSIKTRLSPHDKCIHGHFQANKYKVQFPDAKLITCLRDPVERLVSHYYHWKRNPDKGHTISRLLNSESLSLTEFASLDAMRNIQSRYLLGTSLEDFCFIGIQEHFDEMMPFLYKIFNREYKNNFVTNANPERNTKSKYDIDERENKVIKEANQLDIDLYNRSLDLAYKNNWL